MIFQKTKMVNFLSLSFAAATSIATSLYDGAVQITPRNYAVTSDCSYATAQKGEITVSNNILGDNYQDFGFPSSQMTLKDSITNQVVIRSDTHECLAFFIEKASKSLLFVCEGQGETCTIFLE